MIKRLAITLFLLLAAAPVYAICNAKFINPITEVCWSCIFPLSVGSIAISPGTSRPDPPNPASPICFCGTPFPRIGLAIGLWEPARLVDVANEPGCFVNMGFKLNLGIFGTLRSSANVTNGTDNNSKWQAHLYHFPLISWLGTVVSGLCMGNESFDVVYTSELDPLWNSDELTNLLNPEAVLFANPIAQAACAAECVITSGGGLPLHHLFWCNGCSGALYPINGTVNTHVSGIQASHMVAMKMQARMHRVLAATQTRGTSNAHLCSVVGTLTPIIPKRQYRHQLTRPTAKVNGRYACAPPGFSTQLIDSLREYPVTGESFGWLTWRKRNCCAL